MRGAGCLRDDDDVVLREEPGERGLRRRHAVALREFQQSAVLQQPRLLDRRIGHDGSAASPAPRQQIPLDATPRHVVQHLIRRDIGTAIEGHQFIQISDIEIQANEIIRYREVLNGILSKHTGQTIEKIAKDTDRDFFMSAEEAKAYGAVDDVLKHSVQPDALSDKE